MSKKLHAWLCIISFVIATNAYAQTTRVIGTVKDGKGNFLPGVSIKIKNTQTQSTTDKNGNYAINVKDGQSVLVFSYIGFLSKEIILGDKKVINVTLNDDLQVLNQVIVVGYGAVKKSDLTGSVAQVNMGDLTKAPVATFAQALAGRVAGVQVSSGDGQPGGGVDIVIRGAGSLTQDVSPLYVIDGFPMEGFDPNYLSPSDIESINILKDASSTAIYGARGANGVIVIETKKGKVGMPQISYSGSYGMNNVTKRMEMMSPYEFVKFQLEKYPAEASASLFPDFHYVSGGPLPDAEIYKDAVGIDWQDRLYRSGFTAINNLAMSGGTATTKYVFSGSAFNQQGTVINTGYSRYQGRLSLDQVVNKKLRVGVNVTYANVKSHGALASQNTVSGNGTNALFYNVWGYRPVAPEGSNFDDFLIDPDIDSRTDLRVNPVIDTENQDINRYTNGFLGNTNVTWTLAPNLILKIQGGLDSKKEKNDYFFNSQTGRGTPLRPGNLQGVEGGITFRQINVWSNDNTLTYKTSINKNHVIDALVGFSIQGTNYELFGMNTKQLQNESLGLSGLDEGQPFPNNALIKDSRLLSTFGRINYNYKSKYLFTVTARADGSSKFAPGKRWGYFPSGAAAWKMKEENFMKNISAVTEAKLRVSYGFTGNNRVGDFDYLPSINSSVAYVYPFNNQVSVGAAQSSFGNADLKWETTEQMDIGYDLSLFKNKIELTADVYRKTTRDLLVNSKTPLTTGFITAFKNVGTIRNDGLEFNLNTKNITKKDFSWKSSFNISFNRNKLLALNEDEDFILTTVDWHSVYNNQALYTAKVGGPAAQFIGLIWDGVYQNDDFIISETPTATTYELKPGTPTNGVIASLIRPGDIKYRDINGDGIISNLDRTVIGRATPVHTGGFANNFTYKNFNLNVFFQWSYGNDIMNANRIMFEGDQGQRPLLNQYASYADRWTPNNTSSTMYRAQVQASGPSGMYSTRTIEDGSYLRLKTIALDYSIPDQYLKKAKIKSLKLSVTAENLYTWTNYSGMDPEVSVRNSVLTPYFDFSAYPRARTIVFSINALF